MLILASNSPRRRELLDLGGWQFVVKPAMLDERPEPGERPETTVTRLAVEKAQAIAQSLAGQDLYSGQDYLVLACDTAVVDGSAILGKPADVVEAARMLQQLQGRTHQVYTAIALQRSQDGALFQDVCVTEVLMRPYTDQEMQDYIGSGDPFDKAGGYGIQHVSFHPVEELAGCYANVMGLPLCHLARRMIRLGLPPPHDLPQACQAALAYTCPVYKQVLDGEI
jgi:septum formation protein